MRKHHFFFLAFVALLSTSVLSVGCKRNKCKNVVCNNGECVDGECVCATGYGGVDCSTAINQKYNGNFSLTEQCTAGVDAYDIYMEPVSGNNSQVRIAGLWDEPRDSVIATVADNGTDFSIARIAYAGQELDATGTLDMAGGTGTIAYNIYQVGAVDPFDSCTADFEAK